MIIEKKEDSLTREEKALVVGIHIKGKPKDPSFESMEEMCLLAETAGVTVYDQLMVSRETKSVSHLIGKGKALEIKERIEKENIDLVLFDDILSPIQERNLRNYYGIKVLDRVEIILDIFAKRAKTYEAKIQIELAQLKYLLPRLTRMWVHLSRQVGGVGVRGPGETQIEIDRRRIREKIHDLNNKIKTVRSHRQLQRKNRIENSIMSFSLIGYTNAGKSTLLNALTGAKAQVKDQLFCTLDPLSRKLELEDGLSLIMVDTVGFINNLPHFLVESFMATLEEVIDSDILVHVIDASSIHLEKNIKAVNEVLINELKIEDKPIIKVFNKCDLISIEQLNDMKSEYPESIFISSANKEGFDELLNCFRQVVLKNKKEVEFLFPMTDLKYSQCIYQHGKITSEEYTENGLSMKAYVSEEILFKINQFRIK